MPELTPDQIKMLIRVMTGMHKYWYDDEENQARVGDVISGLQALHTRTVDEMENEIAQGLLDRKTSREYVTEDRDELLNRVQSLFHNDRYFQMIDYRGVTAWGIHVNMRPIIPITAAYKFFRFEVKPRKQLEVTIYPKTFKAILATVRLEPEPTMLFNTRKPNYQYGFLYFFEIKRLYFW